jgi:hypothetical protein
MMRRIADVADRADERGWVGEGALWMLLTERTLLRRAGNRRALRPSATISAIRQIRDAAVPARHTEVVSRDA